jgi:hypothetical protein
MPGQSPPGRAAARCSPAATHDGRQDRRCSHALVRGRLWRRRSWLRRPQYALLGRSVESRTVARSPGRPLLWRWWVCVGPGHRAVSPPCLPEPPQSRHDLLADARVPAPRILLTTARRDRRIFHPRPRHDGQAMSSASRVSLTCPRVAVMSAPTHPLLGYPVTGYARRQSTSCDSC